MIYIKETDKLKCSKCGSEHIYIKSGMMSDLYICLDCGHESRDIKNLYNI